MTDGENREEMLEYLRKICVISPPPLRNVEERKAAAEKSIQAWRDFQKAMEGAAEEAGWKSEEDVVEYCIEIRREMGRERGYIH
jgi:hypothetical protein